MNYLYLYFIISFKTDFATAMEILNYNIKPENTKLANNFIYSLSSVLTQKF